MVQIQYAKPLCDGLACRAAFCLAFQHNEGRCDSFYVSVISVVKFIHTYSYRGKNTSAHPFVFFFRLIQPQMELEIWFYRVKNKMISRIPECPKHRKEGYTELSFFFLLAVQYRLCFCQGPLVDA